LEILKYVESGLVRIFLRFEVPYLRPRGFGVLKLVAGSIPDEVLASMFW